MSINTTQLAHANVKVHPSSIKGADIANGKYTIQNAAWPHLSLGLRDTIDRDGIPVDTWLVFEVTQAPVWTVHADPEGSTVTFTIQSPNGYYVRPDNVNEKAGIVVGSNKQIFKIFPSHEQYPNLLTIKVSEADLALQAAGPNGGQQVVLEKFDGNNTRQIWVLNRVGA